jgi:hypothetical protein
LPNAASALILAAALAALPAAAQVLYKWVDADGKTQYSDRRPKDFKGEVLRIEPEIEKATLPPPVRAAPPAPARGGEAKDSGTEDIAAKRRATRESLDARLKQARSKVEAARKALADSESPTPEERQVVQQRAAGGGMHGMAARSNCREEKRGNQKILMCPTAVPTEEYRDRIARMEDDVRKAEEELAAAEQAWRRGVD